MSAALIQLDGLIAGMEMNSEIPVQLSELKLLRQLLVAELKIPQAKPGPLLSRVVPLARVHHESPPNPDPNRSTFAGVPLVSVLKTDKGYQVQQRERIDLPWQDVPEGLFDTEDEALDMAPVLCGF